jgi:hypothetical protein
MSEFGNGIAVAIEALQDDFDLVDVFWCAALEAARLDGVVDAGMRRHGGQAQGGAEADAVDSHLVHAIFYHGEAPAGVSPGAFTLSANCFTSIFSWSSSASRAEKCKAMMVSIKVELD